MLILIISAVELTGGTEGFVLCSHSDVRRSAQAFASQARRQQISPAGRLFRHTQTQCFFKKKVGIERKKKPTSQQSISGGPAILWAGP